MMIDHNFGFSLGVAIRVMSALVVGIYQLRRNNVNGEITAVPTLESDRAITA